MRETEIRGKPSLSAYIITRDEERNIARAIKSVKWMDEVIVLDSGSADRTVEIAESLNARVCIEPFRGFVDQKNRAMELCRGDWVFNLDADEEVSPELRTSLLGRLDGIRESDDVIFLVSRRTWYMGRWIRHCGWYPEYRARLSRRGRARWEGEVLHERLRGAATSERLQGDLLHRPYEDLSAHAEKIIRYAGLWAEREYSKGRRASFGDLMMRPAARFLKMYIARAGFLDSTPGLAVSIMGAWYAFMKYARLYELSRNP